MIGRGYVYVARIRSSGLIKIGYSGRPGLRCKSLKGDLLAVMPGSRDDERRIHQRFARWLAAGREWFNESPEIMAFIAEHALLAENAWPEAEPGSHYVGLRVAPELFAWLEGKRARYEREHPGGMFSRSDVIREILLRTMAAEARKERP